LFEPENNVMVPPRSKRISAPSVLGAAARSIVFDMPIPRSFPRLRESARRFAKPSASAMCKASSRFFANSPES
jgi:hypothetical protein